jgi:hypothetical protein
MNSEEMRNELESFVNTGLREGWNGWPLKVETCTDSRLAREWSAAPAGEWLRRRTRLAPAARRGGTFASLHSMC